MNLVLKPLAISLAVAAAFSANASAQSVPNNAQNVVVTAGRQVQAAKDVLADNVVITSEQIANAGSESLVDLLQQQRGIEITRNGGAGTTSSVLMRGGSNAQNVVLIDGVRYSSSTLGGASWETIPLGQIDHIEIVYGPLSSLYGADAMGGVIQIFTKKGNGPAALTASVGAGSYGLRKMQAGVSGSSGNEFNYALNVGHENNIGFSATNPNAGKYSYNADKDGYKLDSASGNFNWQLAPGYETGVKFMQSRLNAQFDAGSSYDDHSVEQLQTIAVYGKAKVNDIWTANLQVAQSNTLGYTDASYGQSQIDTHQNLFSLQNDIRLGKDVLQVIAESRQEKVRGTTAELNQKRTTNSVAASYVWKLDAHLASVSIRNDNSSVYGSNTTGSLAYGYRLTPDWRVNASYGTSFRAPTFNELYYPGYGIASNQPEKAKNAEIGVYYEQGSSQLSAVYYQNKATNLLVSTNVCPVQQSTHRYGCAYNVDKATMSGLTLGANTRFGDLALRGALDIQNPVDDTTGKRLARRAKQHASFSAEYTLAQAKLGVETIFSGDRFDNVTNTRTLSGYSLMNLYGTYALNKDLSAVARWNNALNKDYALAYGYNTPGSNVYVGLNYGFK
ncbi:TonB-dependent receptor [Undibacterium jejuense]|uniref:TonB-dependent receptor n=1 Tax=Undibacterium jejuense TaxID=1344949 RepID=A0A923HF40_9BURK|nr:TonB-dependent receptor [Undibacterium jejuense]MBC3861880.1 TonB-dependent receptor [Undibacterium jejuense]